jgi:perosamine synthetase
MSLASPLSEHGYVPEPRIPVYRPVLTPADREAYVGAYDSGWISGRGPDISRFEARVAEYTGIPGAVAVANGTVALHVALTALGIGPGDEVIVPALSYVATANSVSYTGARPVFADCDLVSLQIDPDSVAARITDRTKAIMVVHNYGYPVDMDRIWAIARTAGIPVVEDCAEALGTRFADHHVGVGSRVATLSFFANKTITTGEGGMVLTDDEELSARIRMLANQGASGQHPYFHPVIGFNYRMTNPQAALGLSQMGRIDDILAAKTRLYETYAALLAGRRVRLLGQPPRGRSSFWLVVAEFETADERQQVVSALAEERIESRPCFIPLNELPMYTEGAHATPNASAIHRRLACLPSFPALTEGDLAEVADTISRALGHA